MISSKTIDRTLEKISAMNEAQTRTFANQMKKEQPYVLVYLLAIGQREEFDDDEVEIFFHIGSVIWQVMRQNQNGTRKVTEQALMKAEKANETILEKMESDSEGDFFSAAEKMAFDYPEPDVFRYIIEALMEDEDGDPDNPPFREETLGIAFLHLKIVLDVFIQIQR